MIKTIDDNNDAGAGDGDGDGDVMNLRSMCRVTSGLPNPACPTLSARTLFMIIIFGSGDDMITFMTSSLMDLITWTNWMK